MPTVLALPDKFRGSATAAEVGGAIAQAAADAGWQCEVLPVSDGGEGLLECFGGPNRATVVAGALGEPVEAAWRLDGTRAVIEMATASGLALVADYNDPLAATTRGTGELIAAAFAAGASDVLVGVGGSATTDGGSGALDALERRLPGAVTVAADVTTRFTDAAAQFGPQKGADRAAVEVLTARLATLRDQYRSAFGVDVGELPGSGAAGGLAGGLAALGARIRPGFDVVAEQLDLRARIAAVDLVITGEGRFDETSLRGKAPAGVIALCRTVGTPVSLVVGELADGVDPGAAVVSLTARVGRQQALADPLPQIRAVVRELLR